MKLIRVINNVPQITDEALGIPVFFNLWNRDKSKTKDKALQDLAFVYYFCDPSSVYFGYADEERIEELERDVLLGRKLDNELKAAIQYYDSYLNTKSTSIRYLQANLAAVRKMEEFFNSIDFTETNSRGQLVYDITKVTNAIEKSGKLITSLEQIKERVVKELEMDNKVRGNQTKGFFED